MREVVREENLINIEIWNIICNAPATFNRLMETVLRELIDKICLIYLDVVVVFKSTVDERLRRISTGRAKSHHAAPHQNKQHKT